MLIDKFKNRVSGVTFAEREVPVPYNYRLQYRMAQIVLILGICVTKGSCSWIKMQMLSSAINYEKEYEKLIRCLQGMCMGSIPYIKSDPALYRAIGFAEAEGLVEFNHSLKLSLTKNGQTFYDELMNEVDILMHEKEVLQSIGSQLTETKVESFAKVWRSYYV